MKTKVEELIQEAKCCYLKRDYTHELETWRKVHELEPNEPEWEHNIGLALLNSKRYYEAFEILDRLSKKHPKLARVHNNLGALLIRMGVDLAAAKPIIIQGLATSVDMDELIIHFMNTCGIIGYGSDRYNPQEFDSIDEIIAIVLKRVSPPELLDKNTNTLLNMSRAYREIACFREAFAQRRWRAAEEKLNSAIASFSAIGLQNFSRGTEQVRKYFEVCKGIFETLEVAGSCAAVKPEDVLEKYENIQKQAATIEIEEGALLGNLFEILKHFLQATIGSLRYLSAPFVEYKSNEDSRVILSKLSAHAFTEMGCKLNSFLQFIEEQCRTLDNNIQTLTNKNSILLARDGTWSRIVLFCNGLSVDFRDIDIAIVQNALRTDPLEKARLELHGFKLFIERQAHKDMYVDGKPQENIGRALLQAYLTPRSYREVPVRGGQTDIMIFEKNGRYLYETKIWRGLDHYEKGIRELEEYIIGEGDDGALLGVFYIIFDPTKNSQATAYCGSTSSYVTVKGHDVERLTIDIHPPTPSKKLP